MTTDSGMKAMGSLYSVLLDFVDSARVHDSNYDIASHLLQSYSLLPNMSLRKMADMCFVSQATFSRFCRFIGFDSFDEFKAAVDSANYRPEDDYTREFLNSLQSSGTEALDTYRRSLIDVVKSALTQENLEVMERVMDALEDAGRVAIFSHHFPWHVGRYFQGKMLQAGCYVELPQSYEHQLKAADTLDTGDVALVISGNGTYFSHYPDIARSVFASGATVVTVTQSRHAMFINRADLVLGCGNSNENDIGKYALLMTLDYLAMSYMRRHSGR